MTSAGYRINDEVFRPGMHVPELGEHTKDVLVGLGYSDSEIEQLAEQDVIGTK